ncbi:Rrf2 family transcriptional regulator [Pseudoteredinibacter isoporae]|nr:Rrf2 family transcriptional regulator [Pseudoteredinibacter isoporae]NHO87436.1 Rrf2 family transcriptional regulator [Pseudoteredinibacter isoporae]NIB24233.1 Rrf2 family transcriptional regulator [Pseudoteredinibacter isoporae]
MQLTKHTDYAFRILTYVASMTEEKTTIQKISLSLDISKNHLMKIVNRMASEGWIDASRGKNGGIKLGIPPETLSLREVVEVMEQTLAPVNCDSPLCTLNPHCQLKGILHDAQQAFMQHLGKYTLADLIKKPMPNLIHALELA